MGVALPREPYLRLVAVVLRTAVVLSSTRAPLVLAGLEVPLRKVRSPRRRGEGDDVALTHGQRLLEGKHLFLAENAAQRHGRALAQELVAHAALVLDHGDARGGLFSELLVLEQPSEGVPLRVLLRVRRLGDVNRPRDELAVLLDAEWVLPPVRNRHEARHSADCLASTRMVQVGACRTRCVL